MAGGSYRQVDVVCPFYRSDDGKGRISCEGLVDASILDMHFKRKRDFLKQMEKFCCGECVACGIYMILLKKYE